ncbi:peptidase S8/S53 domain-containing protein [Paraphysoderma sedebokerense]|nr:peptidase S8/S53 domain-containing protein [Paraphysoderma sedebokerense]
MHIPVFLTLLLATFQFTTSSPLNSPSFSSSSLPDQNAQSDYDSYIVLVQSTIQDPHHHLVKRVAGLSESNSWFSKLKSYVSGFSSTTENAVVNNHGIRNVETVATFPGFAAVKVHMKRDIHGMVKGLGGVLSVEKDTVVRAAVVDDVDTVGSDSGGDVQRRLTKRDGGSQRQLPWHLDRIDQRVLPLDNKYDYSPNPSTVDLYVLDTGCNAQHVEFGNRVTWGATFSTTSPSNQDENGHGTHVCGIAGSQTYGVAKNVNIVVVKVLDMNRSGSLSELLAGMNWVAQQHLNRPSGRYSVINLSLGAPFSETINSAVRELIKLQVHVIVAAGNDATDACTQTPASTKEAITVGSTNQYDNVSYFSNIGECLDLFAPGEDIWSTGNKSSTDVVKMSGTSDVIFYFFQLLSPRLVNIFDRSCLE